MADDGSTAQELNLDTDTFDKARAVHRVVRAMHDGECPKCHYLCTSEQMRNSRLYSDPMAGPYESWSLNLTCPKCNFSIAHDEQVAAMRLFAPVMEKNLTVFEEWRDSMA